MIISKQLTHYYFRTIRPCDSWRQFFTTSVDKDITFLLLKKVLDIPKRVNQNKYQVKSTVVGCSFCLPPTLVIYHTIYPLGYV